MNNAPAQTRSELIGGGLGRHAPTTARLAALALVLIAFALRAYRLDFQSLWSDEGISLLRAAQSLPDMWRNMPVEHTPGYFVLLHFWMAATGEADFALRYFSLLPSVWAVALIARLGNDLGGRTAGLIAAALLATNAFQVWYAQEARMYGWLLASGLFATWCFWLLLDRRSPAKRVWLGYVLSVAATVYLHFFGFLVPLVHTVAALLWLARTRDSRIFLRWTSAGVAVFMLFLPWAARSLDVLGFSGWRAPLDPNRVPWLLLHAYTASDAMPAPWSQWIPLVYLALALIGAAAWIRRRPGAGAFLTVIALCAVLITWLLVVRRPDFHVRYTIFVSAPLLLLAAGGIAALDPAWLRRQPSAPRRHPILRLAPLVALIPLLAANGLALHRLYTDASLHKPDFRSAAATISAGVQASEAVLVDGPNPDLVFNHYYRGAAPVHDLRSLEGVPAEELDAALRRITHGTSGVWELLYFKPPGPVQVWLATHGWPAAPTYHNGIRVQHVALDQGPLHEQPIGLTFGDTLELVAAATDQAPRRPGDLLRVTTRWQTHAQPPEYKFSLRLAGPDGQPVVASDYAPQNWFAPTNAWAVGMPAVDQHALLLPGDLAPGTYRVTLRLYDPANGVAVETAAGADAPLADVEVIAPVDGGQ